ncbi:MAG TPA: hypothetical protein VIF83_11310 [Gemmatimonadaceae bacterium]
MKSRRNANSVVSANDARSLARLYYELAGSIGKYRFDNWHKLSPSERGDLESLEWTLLTFSSDMTSRAIIFDLSEARSALREITAATKRLKQSIARLNDVRDVIRAATKAVTLAAAIFSGNAEAVASAVASATD